jgi:hypothetical protein
MTPAPPASGRERGFVLVGVVMFVLALTIIGMSLYGLSGYEAGFLQDSVDREQALHRAAGGQEVVKSLLAAPPYSLQAAKAAQGHAGIVYANAWQVESGTLDSTGTLDWDQPVHVRVTAQVRGITRTVEGRFRPSQRRDPYEHLIASTAWLRYNPLTPGPDSRAGSTSFLGRVWQVPPSDSLWRASVTWISGGPITYATSPTPDRAGFLADKLPLAGPPDAYLTANPSKHVLRLFAVGGGPPSAIFSTPASVPFGPTFAQKLASFDFFVRPQLDIEVRDVAVLIAPRGLFFEQKVFVKSAGGATPTLIVVTGPNERYTEFEDNRNVGIWFFGGLEVEDDVDVFLVSDGEVRIEHFNEPEEPSRATHLTVFAGGVYLMGPKTGAPGAPRMDLRHDPADAAFLARIRDLQSRGLLPAAGGTPASTFSMIPGSWREP